MTQNLYGVGIVAVIAFILFTVLGVVAGMSVGDVEIQRGLLAKKKRIRLAVVLLGIAVAAFAVATYVLVTLSQIGHGG